MNYLLKVQNTQLEILDEIVRICDKHSLTYYLIGGTLLGAVRHNGFIPWDDDLDIAMPRYDYDKLIAICKSDLSSKYYLDDFKSNSNYWLPFIKIRKKNTVLEEHFLSRIDDSKKGIWVDIFPLDNANKNHSNFQAIQGYMIKTIRRLIVWRNRYNKPKTIKQVILYSSTLMIPKIGLFYIQQLVMKWNKNPKSTYYVNFGSKYDQVKQTIPKDIYNPPCKVEFEGNYYKAPKNWDFILKRIYGDYMKLPPMENRVTHNPIRVKFEDNDEIIF